MLLTSLSAHPWAYPALEVVHLLGLAMLFGGLLVFELRLLGMGSAVPLAALARLTLLPALLGFALCAASGLLMFATQAQELLANRTFLLKMGLIAAAGCNAGLFHSRRDVLQAPDRTARVQGLLSLGIWCAVIICGRWIAYS
jgi:hypothetical protein